MTDVPVSDEQDTAEADVLAKARADVLAREDRDAAGRWISGNGGALKTGTRSRQVMEAPALVAAVRERAETMTADLGGMSQLSAAKQALVLELARVQFIAESLGANVLEHGVLTGRGKTRAAVNVYLQVLDRQVRLASLVGLERAARAAGVAGIVATVRGGSHGR